MNGMKVEIVQVGPLPPASTARLETAFTVHRLWEAPDREALVREIAPRVRGMATTAFHGADRQLIAQFPKLEIVSCFGIGVDLIDLDCARERKVTVTNTPDVLTDCVADLGMGLAIALLRRIVEGDRYVRQGGWLKAPLPLACALRGRRLGIVGMGRIGQALAARAAPFGMQVAYYGPRRKPEVAYPYFESPRALAEESDVLALTCPGGTATRHLVDGEVLGALGPKGFLVNVARGSVVDEAALVDALQQGRIAGAALDVFEDEPNVPKALLGMDNVIVQPHVGSATTETREAMGGLVVDNLLSHFEGRGALTPVG